MSEYTKDVEKQQMRDEMAMRVMEAWAARTPSLEAPVNPTTANLDALKERAKQFATTAFAIADGFMVARSERLRSP